jgi:hypothetical protein
MACGFIVLSIGFEIYLVILVLLCIFEITRMYMGSMLFTSPKQQWQLRYSRDVQIDNGMRSEGEISLRYLVSFD